MAKPILLSVDDDSDVLRTIERDLRSQDGAEYRVIGSDSPARALDLLKQLKVRNDNVALLLADQRMPRMDGVEFLQEGMRLLPGAKRALLSAYADANAAISAINQANIKGPFRCWGRSVIGSAVRLAPASDGIVDTILETDHRADYPALRTEPEIRDERLLATSTSAGPSPSFG